MDTPYREIATRILEKAHSCPDEIDAPDWKVGLHILAKIHNRLAELSGSPYRIRADIKKGEMWHWRFYEKREIRLSKFIQLVIAAIVGTALGLTLGHWYFG